MASHISNIRLFFRLVLCNIVSEEELARYLPKLNTQKLIRTVEDKDESEGIRRLALKGLVERTKEPAVPQSFFKVTDQTELPDFEKDVLAILLKHIGDAKIWQLKSDNIRMHSQKSVRLLLAKLLSATDYASSDGDEIVRDMVKYEKDPDVLMEAVLAAISRPSYEMNQVLFEIVGKAPKELDDLVRKALPKRRYHCLENELCEVLKKEIGSSNGKSTRRVRTLRNVILQRIRNLDYSRILELLTEEAIPETDLRERAYQILQKKLQDTRIDCSNLFKQFEVFARKPRERNMIFQAILGRENLEVVTFLKMVADGGHPAEDYWKRAIAELSRRGEIENFKAELLCDV